MKKLVVGKVQFNAAAVAGNGQVTDVSEFREIQTCPRDARIGIVFFRTQLLNMIMRKPSLRYEFFFFIPQFDSKKGEPKSICILN